jgi:putative transposase
MRHSQHTENEILSLVQEANAGIPIAEICSTAYISPRTFYRWRKRYGSLTPAALLQMRELEIENRRLRSLVDRLSERAHGSHPQASPPPHGKAQRPDFGYSLPFSSGKGSEQLRGASVGRFASVRGRR